MYVGSIAVTHSSATFTKYDENHWSTVAGLKTIDVLSILPDNRGSRRTFRIQMTCTVVD